jgi:imidazolonepropionase-like amidohydrolase
VANLKLLHDYGVKLAIGTDSPPDTSRGEVEYLRALKVFDDLTLLKMWTQTTSQSIFPSRKIGALREGYEASFLALEGNPLEDWKNARRIRLRFKQGFLMENQEPDSRLPENDR